MIPLLNHLGITHNDFPEKFQSTMHTLYTPEKKNQSHVKLYETREKETGNNDLR